MRAYPIAEAVRMFASPSVKATTLRRVLALVVISATTASAPWLIRPDSAIAEAAADMVPIAGGAFIMGRDGGGRDGGNADERPAHRVTLGPFLIDPVPVTNADFAPFLNAMGGPINPAGQNLFDWDDDDARIHRAEWHYRADEGFENHPVVEASWHGARDYCRWRAKRLPTEAEWERAARGTEGRPYPWGSQPPEVSRARYGSGWGQTVAVGSLPRGATPKGVMNMAGNVHEWVSSLYKPYPYGAKDGREHPYATGERVTRGGAADTGAETLRATWRGANVSRNPRAGHHNIGFRCAKSAGR
jgi:iron(II)-dependent oxidoreductase